MALTFRRRLETAALLQLVQRKVPRASRANETAPWRGHLRSRRLIPASRARREESSRRDLSVRRSSRFKAAFTAWRLRPVSRLIRVTEAPAATSSSRMRRSITQETLGSLSDGTAGGAPPPPGRLFTFVAPLYAPPNPPPPPRAPGGR